MYILKAFDFTEVLRVIQTYKTTHLQLVPPVMVLLAKRPETAQLIGDNGNEAKVGEPGELYIRGPNVCLGYWRNPAATQDTISPDGWLKTGDVAMTKNNKFWIVDRKKELIKIKGFQVAPAELEAVLLNNDHVDDAAVVGVIL
ncbi:MAG: hypothetical protein LQ350_008601, partial [Teloschistes chrysophthalmus]